LNTSGEKLAKEGVLPVPIGTWLPSLVLIPVGIFLTIKAMRDSQLFNKEFYYRSVVQLKKFTSRINRKSPNDHS
jgi:lipopolysaccharide export system permease protein